LYLFNVQSLQERRMFGGSPAVDRISRDVVASLILAVNRRETQSTFVFRVETLMKDLLQRELPKNVALQRRAAETRWMLASF
jgi:hypothetical protein